MLSSRGFRATVSQTYSTRRGVGCRRASSRDGSTEEVFTRAEVRNMIERAWEEKIRMGEEELPKVPLHHDEIFQVYPLTGYAPTSYGPMPVPFQFFWSSGLAYGGTAEADVAKQMLENEGLHPVVLSDGTVPMVLWVWQHSSTTTSVGHHSNSMQLFYFVTREPLPSPPPAHPLIAHALWNQKLYPQVRCLPYGMWEESDQALAFNREVLGFPGLPALGHLENHVTHLKDLYNEFRRIRGFSFVDTITGHTIIKGESHYWEGGMRSPTTLARLAAVLGPRGLAHRLLSPWHTIPLVSPRSSYIPHHTDTEMHFQANLEQLRLWNKSKPWKFPDRLLFGKTRWATAKFTPKWVWHLGGARGVITPPFNHNGQVVHARIGWESEEPTFPHLPAARVPGSLRNGRIPLGSPLETPGVAHLPSPDQLELERLVLAKERGHATLAVSDPEVLRLQDGKQ